MSDKKLMPVMVNNISYEQAPRFVPISWLSEELTQQHHRQTLQKIVERGGLTPKEILRVMRRPIFSWELTDNLAAMFLTWITIDRLTNNSEVGNGSTNSKNI